MKKHFLLALMTLLPFMGAWAGNVGTFAELKDALAAGGEVTLTADIEVTEILHVNRAVTLDLNGQTITVANGLEEPFIVNRLGVLTVTDGATGGTIDASNVMLGIKMTDVSDMAAQGVAELIVNGGTIKGKDYGISGNGTDGRGNTKVTINGGSIIASKGTGIYNPQTGDLNINGGYIEGLESAVEVRSGNLNMSVTGGELVAKATEYSCNPNGNGTTTKGAALAVAQHTTQNPIAIVIKGGSFTGVKALSVANPQNNGYEDVKVSVLDGTFNGGVVVENVGNVFNQQFVCGGTFTDNSVENYLVNGCTLQANGNGTYSVKGYDVVITLGNIEVAYGNPIPPFTANYFSYVARSNGQELNVNTLGFTKDDLFAAMEFQMLDTPEGDPAAQGSYRYTTLISPTFKEAHPAINNVGGNNGNVNILKRNFNNNQDDLKVIFSPNPIEDQTYTGREIKPEVTVEFLGQTLVAGTDYTVAYENNVNVTTDGAPAYVVLTGAGKNYTGTAKLPFQIIPVAADESDIAVVVDPARYTYTGEEIVPEKVTVTYKGTELTANDFDINYANIDKVNAGEKPFTVSLKGTYSGTKEAYYYIDPVDVATLDITATNAKQYTSQAIDATVTVKFGDKTLTKGEDYTVEFANNINAGDKAEAIVKGVENSNFTGTTTVYYTINKRDLSTTGIQNDEPKLKALTWNGEEQQAEITSWSFYGKQIPALLENPLKVTYVYQVIDNSQEVEAITNAGIYKVIFTADENEPNFKGSKTVERFVVAKAELTAKVKDITVGYGTDWKSQYELVPAEDLSDAIKAAIKKDVKAENFSAGVDGETPSIGKYDISYNPEGMSNNYSLEVTPGTLTITKAQIWAKIVAVTYDEQQQKVVNDIMEVNYGDAYSFDLAYQSSSISLVSEEKTAEEVFAELMEAAAKKPEFKVYKGEELLAENPTDAGDYKVTAAAELENYLVLVKDGNLKIKGVDISKLAEVSVVTPSQGFVYKKEAWEPEVTVTLNGLTLDPNQYEITGYENNVNAGTATVNVKYVGDNYSGTGSATFEIEKRLVTAVAKADEAEYYDIVNGTAKFEKGAELAEPEDEVAVADELPALLADPANVEVSFVNGVPTTAGEHPNALQAKLTETGANLDVLKNYDIAFEKGTLTINKAKVVMELAETIDVTYGEPIDENIIPEGYKPTYKSGLNSQSEIDAIYSLITNFKYTLPEPEEDGRYVVGGDYVITATADATNYDVEIIPGKVNITKRDLTVTPLDQTIEFGESIYPTKYELDGVAYEDEPVIKLVCTETAVGYYEGAITVEADPDADPNFNYNIIVAGAANLTINGKTLIALERGRSDDAVINLLEGYNGKFVNVEIGGSNLKNVDYWYSFCLPFQTTVREISNAFGYAVVDVPDVTNTKEGKVVFKLKVDAEPIAANTLILIKLDEPRNLATNPVKFNLVVKNDDESINEEKSRKIDYNPEFVVEDAAGNSFVPTYTRVDLKNDGEWYLQQGTFYNAGALEAGTNVKSLQGYFNAVGGAGARIFVQEADGTMTAINSATINAVAAEGWYTIDGMKLNAQPTQKGVYINNGKKVVVK